jgi:hypothetical protein
MQKLISAKWVILLTILINLVTTFTVVTIFPSKMWVANASSKANCVIVDQPVFKDFKFRGTDGDTYHGAIYANSRGNPQIASMTITFKGSAPKSNTDSGKLSEVVFSAWAVPNPTFDFVDIKSDGNGLDTSKAATVLSDFTVDLTDGGIINFINHRH